jgi:hypothetical protein
MLTDGMRRPVSRRDAVRSQVIDVLEAQEIKETGNEEGKERSRSGIFPAETDDRFGPGRSMELVLRTFSWKAFTPTIRMAIFEIVSQIRSAEDSRVLPAPAARNCLYTPITYDGRPRAHLIRSRMARGNDAASAMPANQRPEGSETGSKNGGTRASSIFPLGYPGN